MNHLREEDYSLSKSQYEMLTGHKPGNFPKEVVDEAASQIQKLSTSLCQYKDDAQEQEYINNLMAADLNTMKEKFTRYAEISKCPTVQLMCSVVVINIDKILKNQSFDLSNLLKA